MALLNSFNEEFWRCSHCDNPYFEIRRAGRIDKDYDLSNNEETYNMQSPRLIDSYLVVECTECESQITKKEFLENND